MTTVEDVKRATEEAKQRRSGGLVEDELRLRDYFAAAALTGLIANSGNASWDGHKFALAAFITADCVLKERAK